MANTQDFPGYAGNGAPVGPYGWYAEGTDELRNPTSRVVRLLWVVVVVLGLATFAVSVSSSAVMSFPVRLAVLAAAIAAVGLLPRQAGHGWIVLAFAITGSLDALAMWIVVSGPGWAPPVIFVLNALQSLAAVGALLGEAGVLRSGSVGEQDYSAYAAFAAYQAYVAQYQQPSTPYYAAGQAAAEVHGVADASASSSGAPTHSEQQSEALRAKYAQYGGYSTAEGSRDSRQASGVPVAEPALPGAIRGESQPQQRRFPEEHSRESPSS
jgi:Family of unknown function (DUF5336)